MVEEVRKWGSALPPTPKGSDGGGGEGPAAADGAKVTDDHSQDDDPCHL